MMKQTYPSDIGFSPSVKAVQTARGSRRGYQNMEEKGSWKTEIFHDLKDFIETRRSIFLATVNADGQPYIQHRGGPKGFLKVLDERTIGFADYSGNRQFISTGNLTDNPKAHLFLIDYATRQRVKIWGTAKAITDQPELLKSLMPIGYKARGEQVILFTVSAWDANCPQHIPQMFEAEEVTRALAARDQRIAVLEEEVRTLRKVS